MSETTAHPAYRFAARARYPILSAYLTIVFPVLLVLISIRFVMTPLFLQIVYNQPGFPEDYYGFTTQDRLDYAPYALAYLLNGEDISFLGNLRFSTGPAMYNDRELQHMEDVKTLTQYAYGFAWVAAVLALLAGLLLARQPSTRPLLRRGLMNGSLLTLAIIAAIVIVAIVNWDFFFTSFHQLFFTSGTWRFQYSDTLIRLFPEQFWFEAALTIGGLTVLGAVATLFFTWKWRLGGDI